MAAAVTAWGGALLGGTGGRGLVLALAGAALLTRWASRWMLAGLLVAAAASGWAAASRIDATLRAEVPEGWTRLRGSIVDEPVEGTGGTMFVFRVHCRVEATSCRRVRLPPLGVETAAPEPGTVGDAVEVRGRLEARPGSVRGDPIAGRLVDATVVALEGRTNPLLAAGNALRAHVTGRLADRLPSAAAALMSGLLIGDTGALGEADLDALRRSGLTHFVAVSGSNVALFLAAWWLVSASFGAGPRWRAAWGLAGLGLFVVATRWEASVVRASTMAGLVLAGRALAVPIDAWAALGAAVTGLILFSGDLASNVGFQLSVAATAGVLAGARFFHTRSPRLVWTALSATAAAQIAVTPLLLVHFGTVPLLSPLANVLAAPLVTVATAAGGIGVVLGWSPLLDVGLLAADGVLRVARIASGWPQLGWQGVGLVAGGGLLLRIRRARPAVLIVAAAFAAAVMAPYRAPEVPLVTVLDVGQGDAVLIQVPGGEVMLVDGGRDAMLLRDKLRDRNVSRIDIVAVTHGDDDHLGGLIGLPGSTSVGAVWVPRQPELGPALGAFAAESAAAGIPVEEIGAGHSFRLGALSISVLGPKRRYRAENDASLVLLLESKGRSMLLAGDIEAVAQREIEPPPVDVLLVPHHGSATSDIRWLRAVAPETAVVSVGLNRYGHPASEVLAALDDAGARVLSTLEVGDVEVRFP